MRTDFESNRIILEGETIYLTATQGEILKILYNKRDKVVSFEEFANKLYNCKLDTYIKKTIRKHVSLLNQKVFKYIKIKNIRGIGYVLEGDINNEC